MKEQKTSTLVCSREEKGSPSPHVVFCRDGKIYIAHSSDFEKGVMIEQRYEDHVTEVRRRALKAFDNMAPYLNFSKEEIVTMREILYYAAEYHDLGKLDLLAQETIYGGHKRKMLNHVDAGVSYAINKYKETKNKNYIIVAVLISSHHIGILNELVNKNRQKGDAFLFRSLRRILNEPEFIRDSKIVMDKYYYYEKELIDENETVKAYIDRTLPDIIKIHQKCVGKNDDDFKFTSTLDISTNPCLLRFILSCLVEGDHWDTSRHYRQIAPSINTLPFLPEERNKYYDMKYEQLVKDSGHTKKNKVRRLVKEDCEKVDLSHNFYGLYAYPSYGKTLSGAVKLPLRLNMKFNLRGVIYAATFNNILSQNIKAFEDYLCLPNEKKTEVIGEHYQEASHFERAKSSLMYYKLARHYGVFWQCPFEVVSVVSLFETISSNHPVKLRKLHQLPGRVIVIDEFHTAIPTKLLRQTLKWLKILTEKFGCKVVLMSGSPVKFWEIRELKSCDITIKEILSEKTIRAMKSLEKHRLKYIRLKRPFKTLRSLCNKVMSKSKPGPRVVVFNTVTTAAAFAKYAAKKHGANNVVHLSTSLTPKHRREILEDVKKRINNSYNNGDTNWVLVATSCIESGVNLSFRTGFRESNCLLSLFQIGGRVNRDNEYGFRCNVYSFKLNHDFIGTTNNPAFYPSIIILDQLFEEGLIDYQHCTESVRRDLMRRNFNDIDMKKIEEDEKRMVFGSVARLYKIIPHAYKSVIVDEDVKRKAEEGQEAIGYKEILDGSVQIFYTKMDKEEYSKNVTVIGEEGIPVDKYLEKKIKAPKELNIWTGKYDPKFLGYMEEILSDSSLTSE